ncbi:Zn-ribbon domain-containing OB-fold protein [Amycolatopsis silviterrae]|uniref:Zn-ribbon domain-containing OB-fold protein n=1 Tax=Amycolatopsis silviterrae TaxID=1656914 RepID=A0ABW5H7K8_9PSEU
MSGSAAAKARLAPSPTPVAALYWDAARRGALVLQQCVACRRLTHPPAEWCAECGSSERVFVPVEGDGAVETFSVVHRTFAPGFAERVPYVIAWISLDVQAGLRMFGNVLGTAPDDMHIGLRVEVLFEDIEGYGTVPNFRPVREEC